MSAKENVMERVRKVTQLPGENPADCARRMGWKPGTRLIGDEGHGNTIMRITAIGEKAVLGVGESDRDGIPRAYPHEGLWTFDCREWEIAE